MNRNMALLGRVAVRAPGFFFTFIRSLAYHAHLFRLLDRQFEGLHLGSGATRIEGFCNIDANPLAGATLLSAGWRGSWGTHRALIKGAL